MDWLFENPLPAIIVGGLTAAMLGGGWLQTGRKWLLYAMLAAITLTFGAVIIERLVVTDREQITTTLHEIAAAVERNEIDTALTYAYSGSPEVRSHAAAELARYEFSQVDIKRNLEIEVYPGANPPRAVAEFNVTVQLSVRNTLYTNQRIPRWVQVTFYQEDDGAWRVGAYQHDEPTRGWRVEEGPGDLGQP
jgi:hypothetical protein